MKSLKNEEKNNYDQNFFKDFVKMTGLSPIFAESSMKRACHRAGIDPEKFSKSHIESIISDVERILSLYLSTTEVQQRIYLLQSLAK